MRSLEARLSRLEEKRRKKRTGAPTRAEFDDAAFRQRTRNAYSSRLKLWQIRSWDEEELLGAFSDRDRAFLEADTEEQKRKDADVMRRYERANGLGAGEEGEAGEGVAARVRQKLRSLRR